MAYTKDQVAAHLANRLSDDLKRLNKVFEIAEKLKEAEIPFNGINPWNHHQVQVTVKDKKLWTKIHKIFGTLMQSYISIEDADKRTVEVSLKPKNPEYQEYVRFKYVKELEPVEEKPTQKCKLVKKVSEYWALECDT